MKQQTLKPSDLIKSSSGGFDGNSFAKTGLALIALPLICTLIIAPFHLESAELAMLRDAVLLPLLIMFGAFAVVGLLIGGIMFLCASLPARRVRVKLK
jgi:uncharacterized integral membrane protein